MTPKPEVKVMCVCVGVCVCVCVCVCVRVCVCNILKWNMVSAISVIHVGYRVSLYDCTFGVLADNSLCLYGCRVGALMDAMWML